MNSCETNTGDCKECRSRAAYVVAILGAFLIVAVLVYAMKNYMKTPDLGAARAAERSEKLKELRADESTGLHEIGWVDQSKGVVRLPIDAAIELELREWQNNPAEGRAKLIARVEKANAVPPKAPEKPSQFE
ncbi:MAG TPA: hypothetical protein VH255_10520 [Verrucomicrobiae bacterium]|jgi:hypothetical protein|nr:hypothetical protein [Verrucomicrobiae bacterium]